MNRLAAFVCSNSFSSNAFLSFASNIVARLITLSAVAAITRIYPANEFGVWVLILAFANFFGPFCTFRLEIAMVLAPTKRLARGLLLATCLATILMSAAVALLLGLGPGKIIERTFSIEHAHASLITFVPCLLLLIAIQNILQLWLMRQSRFQLISLATIVHALITAVMVVVIPRLIGAKVSAIVAGSAVGYLAAITILLFNAWPDLVAAVSMRKPVATSIAAVKKYKVYPRYMFPQSLSSIFSERILQFLLAGTFSVGLLGAYFVARQSLLGPATILASSVRNVIFAHGARDVSIATTQQRTRGLLNMLLMVIAPALAWGIFWVSKLALLVFGSKWPELPIMSWYCMFPATAMIFTGPLDRLFDLAGRQRLAGILQLSFDAFTILVALLVVHGGASGTHLIAVVSMITVLYNMTWLSSALRAIRIPHREIAQLFFRFFGVLAFCCALQYAAAIVPDPVASLLASIAVLGLTGFLGLYRAARQLKSFGALVPEDFVAVEEEFGVSNPPAKIAGTLP